MNKGSLRKHEIELVVQPGPGLHDGRCVGQAADGPADLGQVASGYHSWRLVVDADLLKNVPFDKPASPNPTFR